MIYVSVQTPEKKHKVNFLLWWKLAVADANSVLPEMVQDPLQIYVSKMFTRDKVHRDQ